MTHTGLYETQNETPGEGDTIIDSGRFQVREMRLTWEKAATLWAIISKFKTLFSDITRGDLDNFLRFILDPTSVWLEIYDAGNFVGIVTLTNMQKIVDTDAHVIFFDRNLADKVPICRRVVKWAFEKFPLQRITVEVPHFYYATVRLVKEIGFKEEGRKRDAVLIGGRWATVHLFGITRPEVKELEP